MKKMGYEAPDAVLFLLTADFIMASSGSEDPDESENTWDKDTVIHLPPVKLP